MNDVILTTNPPLLQRRLMLHETPPEFIHNWHLKRTERTGDHVLAFYEQEAAMTEKPNQNYRLGADGKPELYDGGPAPQEKFYDYDEATGFCDLNLETIENPGYHTFEVWAVGDWYHPSDNYGSFSTGALVKRGWGKMDDINVKRDGPGYKVFMEADGTKIIGWRVS